MRDNAWWFVLIALGLVALGLLIWWMRSSEQARPSEREAPTATRAEPDAPQDPAPTKTTPTPGQERSALDRPSLAPQRLEFDRRPWDPKKEVRERYEWRAEVIDGFDRFVAETGISDEQAQKLLLIMYDYQENEHRLREEIEPLILRGLISRQELEKWQDDAEVLYTQVREETKARARAVLTPDEYRKWWRMWAETNAWITLVIERVIVPSAEAHPAAPGT